MVKNLLYLISLMMVLTSCEEYYHANLDEVDNLLVSESRICNDTARNFVRLTHTANFNDRHSQTVVAGASCEILPDSGQSIPGIESSDGYFKFPFVPENGKKYKLAVKSGEYVYESDFEEMPSLPGLDSIYAVIDTLKTYESDAYGNPSLIETKGFVVRVDVPVNELNKYYQFTWRVVFQWKMAYPGMFTPPLSPIYKWKSFYGNENFNLAGPKEYSNSTEIRSHKIMFENINYDSYLDSTDLTPAGWRMDPLGWIILINQNGISENSYRFLNQMNDQLEATGQLFDPVYTQVYGNIHCVSNPDKLVLGNFGLCSYREHRLFVMGYKTSSRLYQHASYNKVDIPETGSSGYGIKPDFWENEN